MHILLIAPKYHGYTYGQNYFFNLGIAYISAVLKKEGHDVSCLNTFHIPQVPNCLEKSILKCVDSRGNIDLVGISGLSSMYAFVSEAVAATRRVSPESLIAVGGNVATTMPESIILDLPIDYAILGEGELPVIELIRALESNESFEAIQSLAYRHGKRVIVNQPGSGINELDSIPFPDFEGFEFGEYLKRYCSQGHYSYIDNPRPMPLLMSRSCPRHCTFCYHPPQHKYRQRSVLNAITEVDYMIDKFNINIVEIYDEILFTSFNRERIFELCAYFQERKLLWGCQVMVDAVDEDILMTMKDSGCQTVSYGIENISPRILKSMRKGMSLSKITEVLETTYKVGLDIQGNILFGDSEETWESALENLSWWLANRKYCLNILPITLVQNKYLNFI